MILLRIALLCLVCGAFAWPVAGYADADVDLEESQQRLEQLQQQIETGLRKLRAQQAQAGSLVEDLERHDAESRRLTAAVKRSERELQRIDSALTQRQQELKSLQGKLGETEGQVRKRLAVLYKNGETGLAKVLLGATRSPYEVAENHYYLTRMVRHDRQLIASYRSQATAQEEKLAELQGLREQQLNVRERRRREQSVLTRAGQEKRRLLKEIQRDEALQAAYLDELRARAARLEGLVKKLETDLTQTYTDASGPFREQEGRLAWPVDGRLRVGFGKTRNAELGTMLDSNGLEIAAGPGTPVRVVWGGKVLFASPFRGYGKLMIVDHGNKYYSLYAYVARFTRQSGERVAPGDIIAYTGFEGRDSLYFEIRRSGQPLDPLPWLKPR